MIEGPALWLWRGQFSTDGTSSSIMHADRQYSIQIRYNSSIDGDG